MNILSQKIAAIEKHISTHSERSVEDIAAVTTLNYSCKEKTENLLEL